MQPAVLNDETFEQGILALSKSDQILREIVARRGVPVLWSRPTGWCSLVRLILEQQVSLASGKAAYRRLSKAVQPFTAARVAGTREESIRSCGITRQKSRYIRELAGRVRSGTFSARRLCTLDNDEARAALCELTGIGPWTADCYLLMSLRRADVWPPRDLALDNTIASLYGRSDPDKLIAAWRPWRSVAARLLWHEYLESRSRPAS